MSNPEFLFAIVDTEDGFCLAVNPRDYWEQNTCLYDQHMSEQLTRLFGLTEDDFGDEVAENQFMIEDADETAARLTKAGLIHSPEMERWLQHAAG